MDIKVCMKPRLSFEPFCLCNDCQGIEEITEVIVEQEEVPDNVIYVDFATRTVIKKGA